MWRTRIEFQAAKVCLSLGEEGLEDGGTASRLQSDFEQKGFTRVTILHTTDPSEAQTEAFVKPLTTAKGIWFTGGRQWRLADSYLGNRSQEEFTKLLDRGGVIAGSSAGATIQGSCLARGDRRTNTMMMGDHEEGFGFVSKVAIDQHELARNRQSDLFQILAHHPDRWG
jgi:cyanophycinase